MAILGNKQFMYPITPTGKASMLDLMTEASHRISGDMMIISFDADPEVVREYTPEPLEVPDDSGRLYLWTFEGWHYTDRMATEFISEKRIQYAESWFMLPCELNGERYYYMLFSWENQDWLAYLGRHAGMPHKISDVQISHFHSSDDVYGGPSPGARVTVTVDCVGRVLRASIDFEREYRLDELPIRLSNDYWPRHLGRRFFWDVCNDRPLVDDLVAHWADDMEVGTVWGGPAEVEFFDAENEEVLLFQPLRVHAGWRFPLRFHHRTTPPVMVHDYLA